jgi:hypothetical protein
MLSIAIHFDYSLDPGGEFAAPPARAALDAAAYSIGQFISGNLPAEHVDEVRYVNPSNGEDHYVHDVTYPENTIVVYVGGRDMDEPPAALGRAWRVVATSSGRLLGGSIAFDTGQPWFYDVAAPVPADAYDFYSVAVHELGHILGVGPSPSWAQQISDGLFHGPAASAEYGGPVPVDPEQRHFASNVQDPVGGKASMSQGLSSGFRKAFTALDFAALSDLGWSLGPRHRPMDYVAGDFDRDGRDDLFFWDPRTGNNQILYRYGFHDGRQVFFEDNNRLDPAAINNGEFYQIVSGDFNNDGHDDLFFWHPLTGENKIALSRREGVDYGVTRFDVGINHVVAAGVNGLEYSRLVAGDFDGDGRSDLFFWHPGTGANKLAFRYGADNGETHFQGLDSNRLDPTGFNGSEFLQVVSGRFDADNQDDLFFWHPSTGANKIALSRRGEAEYGVSHFDPGGYIEPAAVNGREFQHVVAANLNGVGGTDLFFWHPGTGANKLAHHRGSSAGATQFDIEINAVPAWRVADYAYVQIASGDFNNNGAADLYLYRLGGLTDLVHFEPENRPPTAIQLAPNTVAENSPVGTPIGTLATVDPDAAELHTYELLDDANGRFTLVGNEVRLATDRLNFEAQASYQITVRVTDLGLNTLEQVLQIDVLNVREDLIATGADYGGGPHVKVFDGATLAERFSFYAYAPAYTGGVRVAAGDVNGDGTPDIITGTGFGGGPHVRVFDGVTGENLPGPIGNFFAYAPAYTGGLYLAAGDFNHDGRDDIVTGVDFGGGPHIRVFNGADGSVMGQFFAYWFDFTGGVRVAVGDVDGDGTPDIITGAGPGGGPHVQVWHLDGTRVAGPIGTFFVYAPVFTAGIYVAAGDLDGDGRADVITGAGREGGPHVRGFRSPDLAELANFFAYDGAFTGGVRVATGDFDADGRDEIITSPGAGTGPHVRIFRTQPVVELASLLAYAATFDAGVFVAGTPAAAQMSPPPSPAPPPQAPPVQEAIASEQRTLLPAADDQFSRGLFSWLDPWPEGERDAALSLEQDWLLPDEEVMWS